MTRDALALLWHRRDLRLHDNAALHMATQAYARVLGVFILDRGILDRADTAPARVQFMLASLAELQENYASRGGRLVVRQGQPLAVLRQLARDSGAAAAFWNEDVEPYAIARDRQVREGLTADGIEARSFQDMLLHEPEAIATRAGKPYSVYSPFWRNWSSRPKPAPYSAPNRLQAPDISSIPLPTLADLGFSCQQELPTAGESAALERLDQFWSSGAIFDYRSQRNLPACDGTSGLSPHLRWGTIGVRQVWQATVDAEPEIRSDEGETSLKTWRQELAWREFYKHALYHWPQLETQVFQQQFKCFEWDTDRANFEAWCSGQTGYPIVDAAMRQLNQTGWMHNRCRMIVASFLTKDLLLDWRWGEQYFMQMLVDGDLAANNGGWQWSAGVGTDRKPLRIFNPSTQAKRYDPEGEYIRRYVPELAGLDLPQLLDANRLGALERQGCGYPQAIVDHKLRQREFKLRYYACKS
ncbi:deoxyribodipyrimidine photo-lyase [Synechococcus sp. PCC 7336]|uniref:cryptochrome/photolyase family protein n=1 Tax=Synechococcus sp. PCC 7336 TaxID=195250 RepID=UPI00034C06EB|nr:deoxyribodipyrimidine photo-lyase [Synechococcus sp. PCC 7336]